MLNDAPDNGLETLWAEPLRKRADEACLADLIAVLEAHPAGLRRWSVMRAMRLRASKAGREIIPKFEDEVERVFRRHCEGDELAGSASVSALFYRPKERAGEVWAIRAGGAKNWDR